MTFVRFFFAIALSLSVLAADNENTSPAKVRVFAPTTKENPTTGRVDALRLEMGEVPVSELGDTLREAHAVLPQFDAKHPPIVPYYMSRMASPEERAQMVRAAEAEFEKVYPGVKPRIQVRYLEDDKVDLEALYKKVVEHIDETATKLPQDQQTAEGIAKLKEAALAAFNETVAAQKAEEGRLRKWTKPGAVKRLIGKIAIGKALVNVVVRGTQIAKAGFQGPLPLLSGVALMASDSAAEYFGTRFEVNIGKAFGEHPIPFASKSEFLTRLNGYYKDTRVAKFVKGTLATTIVYGVARPALNQQLGHWANPGQLAGVTGENLLEMAGAGLVSSTLYYGGFDGYEYLRQKGWINQPVMELGLRATGVLWQASEILFSIGHPAAKAVLPPVLGAMWAGYGGAWALGWFLPARNNRFVLVDSRIPEHLRHQLNELEALESTKPFRRGGADLPEIEKLRPVKRGILSKACKHVMGMFAQGIPKKQL